LRRGTRNCSPYCRTIAVAGLNRIPTPPRSSTKAHSAAIRLTTSSAVKIDVISTTSKACASLIRQSLALNFYRPGGCSFRRVIPEIDIWRIADLMLKHYGDNAQAESARRVDELAEDDDHAAPGRVVNHCDHHRSEFSVALLTVHQYPVRSRDLPVCSGSCDSPLEEARFEPPVPRNTIFEQPSSPLP